MHHATMAATSPSLDAAALSSLSPLVRQLFDTAEGSSDKATALAQLHSAMERTLVMRALLSQKVVSEKPFELSFEYPDFSVGISSSIFRNPDFIRRLVDLQFVPLNVKCREGSSDAVESVTLMSLREAPLTEEAANAELAKLIKDLCAKINEMNSLAVEPAAESVAAQAEPAAKSVAQPAAEQAVEPAAAQAEPVAEQAAQPAAEQAACSAAKQGARRAAENKRVTRIFCAAMERVCSNPASPTRNDLLTLAHGVRNMCKDGDQCADDQCADEISAVDELVSALLLIHFMAPPLPGQDRAEYSRYLFGLLEGFPEDMLHFPFSSPYARQALRTHGFEVLAFDSSSSVITLGYYDPCSLADVKTSSVSLLIAETVKSVFPALTA